MDRASDILIDAEDFLGAAEDLYKVGRWSKVCFNAQQAAELAVKAALSKVGREVRGHSIITLIQELANYIPEAAKFIEYAKLLDQYYIPTRYANAFDSGPAKEKYTERQAGEAIKMASEILEWVKRNVVQR